jgi:hypothetical protein
MKNSRTCLLACALALICLGAAAGLFAWQKAAAPLGAHGPASGRIPSFIRYLMYEAVAWRGWQGAPDWFDPTSGWDPALKCCSHVHCSGC